MPAITLNPTPFLRLALLGDAAASGATGLLLAAAAGPLTPFLGLPEPLLRGAGVVLLPYAACIAWAGIRAAPPRWAVCQRCFKSPQLGRSNFPHVGAFSRDRSRGAGPCR